MAEAQQAKGKIQNWIVQTCQKHPSAVLITYIGGIASIIGLAICFITPKSELAFCVNPIRTPIVQSSVASGFNVSYHGITLTGDVTAAQVAVWNRGSQPIRNQDILSPIILRANASILELTLLKTNRAVAGFTVHADTNMVSGVVSMDWKILQKNDAALIQIIYSGTPQQPLTLEGAIPGQDSPTVVQSGGIPHFLLIGVLLSLVFLPSGVMKLATTFPEWISSRFGLTSKVAENVAFGIVILMMVSLVLFLVKLLNSSSHRTTFGF